MGLGQLLVNGKVTTRSQEGCRGAAVGVGEWEWGMQAIGGFCFLQTLAFYKELGRTSVHARLSPMLRPPGSSLVRESQVSIPRHPDQGSLPDPATSDTLFLWIMRPRTRQKGGPGRHGECDSLWPPSQETGRGAVCSHSTPSQLARLDSPEAKPLPSSR